MPGIVDVQDWMTMWGDYSVYTEIEQSIEESIETSGSSNGIAILETLAIENCTVYLEGSDDGQTFVTVTSTGTDEDQKQVYLDTSANFGSSTRLYKFLRWRLANTSADYYATFRVRVILTSASDGSRRMTTGCKGCQSGAIHRSPSGIITFQRWLCLEGKGTASPFEYPIQPIGQWLDTSGMSSYHVVQELSYVSNADVILESSPFPEEADDLWTELFATRTTGKKQYYVSNETDANDLAGSTGMAAGGGYLRWRVQPVTASTAWTVCFRIDVVPGTQVEGRPVYPRRTAGASTLTRNRR